MPGKHKKLINYSQEFLDKYGDTCKGVGWLKEQDVDHRYRVMIEVIKSVHLPCNILDYGCGLGHLYQYILDNNICDIRYTGLDASDRFLELSRKKFPDVEFLPGDLLDGNLDLPVYDYVIMNGIFTSKLDLSQAEMTDYMERLLVNVWKYARYGVAFNVHSKQVDWEREDLFHLSMDALADLVCSVLSRNFVIRHDYGLYEYTVYVYRKRQ